MVLGPVNPYVKSIRMTDEVALLIGEKDGDWTLRFCLLAAVMA